MAIRPVNHVEGEFYHVYNRGTDKRLMFRDDTDRQRFIKLLYLSNSISRMNVRDILRKNNEPYEYERGALLVSIGAYCLMPNHFHLLLSPQVEGGISAFMHKVCTAYSMYFNRRYNRTGTLLEGPFKSSWVDDDIYLKYLYAYIHLNPLKLGQREDLDTEIADADILEFLNSYPYSSLPDYLQGIRPENKIIDPTPFPTYFTTAADQVKELKGWLVLRADEEARDIGK